MSDLVRIARHTIETLHGPFDVHVCRHRASGQPAVLLVRGDPTGAAPLLARVHSSCVTSECFEGRDCDCAVQLGVALAILAREGRGVLFHLPQEGRGAGFLAKARDRMLVQASGQRMTTFDAYARMGLGHDHRRYDDVAGACRLLGVEAPLRLLTNNPDKRRDLAEVGVAVAEVVPLEAGVSPWNAHYLAAKREAGHALGAEVTLALAAAPPAPVRAFEPTPVPGAERFLEVACYWLPIALDGVATHPERAHPERAIWARLHAHLDLVTGAEPVVFAVEENGAGARETLLRVDRTPLLERFAAHAPVRARWRAALHAMREHGSGCALWLSPTAPGAANEPATLDGGLAALVAHHLAGRAARPLLASAERDGEPGLRASLTQEGVALHEAAQLAAA